MSNYSNSIHRFIKLAGCCDIAFFCHDMTFGNGEINILSTNPNIIDSYRNEPRPAICTTQAGRDLNNGWYQTRDLIAYHPGHITLHNQARQSFMPKHAIHVVERKENCQHMYTFGFTGHINNFDHHVLNNKENIQSLIDRYHLEFGHLIQDHIAPKNRLKLPILPDVTSQSIAYFYHKRTGLSFSLPHQQAKCLQLLLRGKCRKAISKELDLSSRTVEYYLNIIKKKTFCETTHSLIINVEYLEPVSEKFLHKAHQN